MGFNGELYPSNAYVVMTTKGDLVDYDTSRQRWGIGSTNQILQVTAGGLPAWQTLSTAGSILTTQGDVLYENGSGLARLGFGTSGDVLTTKGTGANPVWETPSGGNASTVFTSLTGGSFSSSATSFVAITGATHTIPSVASGKCMNNFTTGITSGSGAYALKLRMVDDDTGSEFTGLCLDPYNTGYAYTCVLNGINDADGQDVYMEFQQDAGASSTLYANTGSFMTLSAFAV